MIPQGFRKGQMLVEVVVAFSISMIAMVALLQLTSRSSTNSGLSSRSAQATAYADEAINWVRQQRDNLNWGEFFQAASPDPGHAYCLDDIDMQTDKLGDPGDPGNTLTDGACALSGDEISGTIYTRQLTLTTGTKMDADGMTARDFVNAKVLVTWTEGSRTMNVYRSSEFFNNNEK